MASKPCRLGGVPTRGGLELCPGPCDVGALQPGFPQITSPRKPAATYARGQTVTIKYQRNNHGPGGFVRHTLVPIEKMMDKKVHARNAFHYGCWGGNSAVAKKQDLKRDKWGYSLVGGDGKLHDGPVGYYYNKVTIPPVVPDGVYVLGWVWYGGMGGSMKKNTAKRPHSIGLFADYWSCAFVKIKGGSKLAKSYTPVFVNELKKHWKDGCNSHSDEPGICKYEPCIVRGRIQKPKSFKNGKKPKPLSPGLFKVPDSRIGGNAKKLLIPTPVPYKDTLKESLVEIYNCRNRPKATRMKKEDMEQLKS